MSMIPDLAFYDFIVVSSSAGKDSQAMLDFVYEQTTLAEVQSRVVVLHCDLGRVEWPGTRDLAEQQAARYGARFMVVSRQQGDLLQHIESMGYFPRPSTRYCTSDHKRGQILRAFTALAGETSHRPVRILSCQGMRAEESPARAKRVPFQRDARASNGRRIVDNWLPIHSWTVTDVWSRIQSSRMSDLVHPAYELGMPRLSCCFCIFAPKSALMLAGRNNPELLEEYVRVEKAIGHRFRVDLSLAEVQNAITASRGGDVVADWRM